MGAFGAKTFRSKSQQLKHEKSFIGKYQSQLKKRPFIFLGLPFFGLVLYGNYILEDLLKVKFERADRRAQEFSEHDLEKLTKQRRKVDIKEEYYKLQGLGEQDWEPVRVKRFKGESENVW
ncbi:Cox16p [Ascoidea rubescens DSM 1968]|uniref:Cytochrome c oxidase assembly protein COX16, mitochondrial n=1 Tax=Ascoidea rubescens DSM 1968 TaxID=1344418 RepID=A0A1D2VG87_9ASCO|nr:cytochrome c oxidase-assembly factor COX16, mitochondrial precursor [Ascoidea rubescens DSM 1968]ODV60681.1 cytochrome c oxidase-assembly factor COX16, mitochondrial precursor [Ascoidea rubescens DSM 1968]